VIIQFGDGLSHPWKYSGVIRVIGIYEAMIPTIILIVPLAGETFIFLYQGREKR
jgi:hypothetical protein